MQHPPATQWFDPDKAEHFFFRTIWKVFLYCIMPYTTSVRTPLKEDGRAGGKMGG
jgi:hypothetical protein